MRMSKLTLLGAATAVGLIGQSAQAGVLFEETFEGYTTGDLISQSTWQEDATDKARTVQAGVFSYGSVNFGSQSLRVTETGTTDKQMYIQFTGSPVSGQDIYVSYYGLAPETAVNPNFYSNLGDQSNTRAGLIGGNFNTIARLNGGSTDSNATGYVDGNEFVVLVRYNWDGGSSAYTSVDVWMKSDGTLIDPDVDAVMSSAAAGANVADIDTIGLSIRGSSWNSTGNQYYDVDNIRVATTAIEAQTGVIPEPASLALLGLGGLAMIRRRK